MPVEVDVRKHGDLEVALASYGTLFWEVGLVRAVHPPTLVAAPQLPPFSGLLGSSGSQTLVIQKFFQ